MSETYEIYTPDAAILEVDKNTNKVYFDKSSKPTGKYTEEYSKAILEADKILRNSPYKDYKPIYLDPELKTGQSSTLLEFKQWQDLYLKDPVKGAIAPWTKAEKAYYESLKTKRERYQYLIIRSGLRSAVIDIPYEAIGGVDEQGRVINPEYEKIFEEVQRNRGTMKSYSFSNEWELSSLFLGNINAGARAAVGFKARAYQVLFLQAQLGDKNAFKSLGLVVLCSNSFITGHHWNKIRAQMIYDLYDKYETLVDSFGMIPYLDELIGVDWIIDLNKYQFAYDPDGKANYALYKDIDQGKLKDPRDVDSTSESRREFEQQMASYRNGSVPFYNTDIPNDWSEQSAQLYMDSLILEAKLAALTPPQGYPNAPFYYSPERLEWIYQKGDLDKKLNPTIPAMYRYNFPEDLRKKIESYAKEHNIS